MPQFSYRGRDKQGTLRTGERESTSVDTLNLELSNEGITPLSITLAKKHLTVLDKFAHWLLKQPVPIGELAVFTRQMQLLHDAGVPTVTALNQLAASSRSQQLAKTLRGVAGYIEKGQSLATGMQYYPDVFSPLMINIIQIGENTGHLGESFGNLTSYLDFEASNTKQIKSAFRYPFFVLLAIFSAVLILNLFVIPSFAKFYTNLEVSLPWQTRVLIATSNFFIHYSYYVAIFLVLASIAIYRYLKTPNGRYHWDKYMLRIPVIGSLLRRMILIRFCQSLAIILESGVSVTQGLVLIKKIIMNTYIVKQISQMQENIERGISFTQSIVKIDLFTQLEIQILAVGEKNGELTPALKYISHYHSQEIQFDLKRMSDLIGPILLAIVSILVLIMALGVYMPIWNMINTVHS